MRYVIDASVALKWVLPGPSADKSLLLRAGYSSRIHQLMAPDICLEEVANVLTKSERTKAIQIGQASVLMADVMQTPPSIHPSLPLLSRALAISSQSRSGFFDCLYVALAEREQCEVITADHRVLNNLRSRFPFIIGLASLP